MLCVAEQRLAGQGRAGQGRAGQGRAGQPSFRDTAALPVLPATRWTPSGSTRQWNGMRHSGSCRTRLNSLINQVSASSHAAPGKQQEKGIARNDLQERRSASAAHTSIYTVHKRASGERVASEGERVRVAPHAKPRTEAARCRTRAGVHGHSLDAEGLLSLRI